MPHIMKGMLHIMKNTKLCIITAVRPDNVMAHGRMSSYVCGGYEKSVIISHDVTC